MKKTISLLFICAASMLSLKAQDADGCKDHPLFNRMPNFIIENCSQNFDALEVAVSATSTQKVEGTVTRLHYVFNNETGQKMPSLLQITKNYENAVLAKGGKKVFSGNPPGETGMHAVFKASVSGKEVWVAVGQPYEPQVTGQVGAFTVWIVEVEGMQQDISASDMLSALNSTGVISLQINFDTGKSTIKPESMGIIDQIYQMMKGNPALKISIEGHTDNAGNAASNKTLSESRAKAVMDAIAAKGIDKSRMVSKGFGQEKPVADNSTDEGKAKNRRVELKKL